MVVFIRSRDAAPVNQEPLATLTHWGIARLDGNLHLVGRNALTGSGRRTTPLQQFDAATMTGTTESGRRYTLLGEPGPTELIRTIMLASLGPSALSCEAVAPDEAERELADRPAPGGL